MSCDRTPRHVAFDDRELLLQAILVELRECGIGLRTLLNRDDGTGVDAAILVTDVCVALWRLADDLGWHLRDTRDLFPLTLPDRYLALALTWMAFGNQTRERLHGEKPDDRRTREVCGELIELLPPLPPIETPLDGRRLWSEPTPLLTLDRDERDLLRHAIVADLGRLSAIAEAIKCCGDDPRPAQLLRRRYEAEFSLLHDLGFASETIETTFVLHAHPQDLEIALLHVAAISLETALCITRGARGDERDTTTELKRCAALCDRLLRELPTTDQWGRR